MSFSKHLQKIHKRMWDTRKWIFPLIAIGLALLSILLTIHADIFEQNGGERMRKVPVVVRAALRDPQPIKLSEYVHEHYLKLGPDRQQGKQLSTPLPLYIFAIDVSGSVGNNIISKEEFTSYLDSLEGSPGKDDALECISVKQEEIGKAGRVSAFEIAKSELCRLLSSVPPSAKVALWTFGSFPQQVVPHRNIEELSGSKFINLVRDDLDLNDGRSHVWSFINWVSGDLNNRIPEDFREIQKFTDIESLFENLTRTYRDAIEKRAQKVHIVILSDFIHDIGSMDKSNNGDGEEGVSRRSEWESRYRVSRRLIANHVRSIASFGNMLHLVVLQGGSISYHNILPLFRDGTLSWEEVREAHVGAGTNVSAFDFLRSYEEISKPLVFHYTGNGRSLVPVELKFDKEDHEGAELLIDLASDSMRELPPLNIFVNSPRDGIRTAEHYRGTIWAGRGGYKADILRGGEDGDSLLLRPSMVLEPHQADRYRLLIALRTDDAPGSSSNVTYSIPIEFYKDFPWLGATLMMIVFWAILLIIIFYFLLWILGSGARLWRPISHKIQFAFRKRTRLDQKDQGV